MGVGLMHRAMCPTYRRTYCTYPWRDGQAELTWVVHICCVINYWYCVGPRLTLYPKCLYVHKRHNRFMELNPDLHRLLVHTTLPWTT